MAHPGYGPAYGQPGAPAPDPRSSPYGYPPPTDHYGGHPPPQAAYGAPPGGHHVSYDAPPPHSAPPGGDPYYQQAPPPQPGYDPYAPQHYGAPPGQYPPPGAYEHPPPSSGHPPPSSYPPPAASSYPPPAGYPPPDYASHGHAYGPPPEGAPPGGAPPPVDPHYAAHYSQYGPPPGYGAPPPGYPPPAYGAPPPAYGYPPPPGYGAPPGYGPPPGYGAPPGYGPPPRGSSPRRDRDRFGDRRGGDRDRNDRGGDRNRNDRGGKGKGKDDRGGNRQNNQRKENNNQKGGRGDQESNSPNDPKNRLTNWLHSHPGWMAVWLEGIDPPRRMAKEPNVTVLMVANFKIPKDGKAEFGFLYAASRNSTKQKERQRDCARDVMGYFDFLPVEDMRSWCQMPESKDQLEVRPGDLERLTKAVRGRCPMATIEMPEPTSFVLVAATPWGPHEKAHGAEAELAMLEKFDPGFAELLREARRVSGLVRKQWFVSQVTAKPEPGKDDLRPFALGFGVATDPNLAKVRSLHSSEVRTQILTDAFFKKDVPQKSVPAEGVRENIAAP